MLEHVPPAAPGLASLLIQTASWLRKTSVAFVADASSSGFLNALQHRLLQIPLEDAARSVYDKSTLWADWADNRAKSVQQGYSDAILVALCTPTIRHATQYDIPVFGKKGISGKYQKISERIERFALEDAKIVAVTSSGCIYRHIHVLKPQWNKYLNLLPK
ncbi:MAG: hypothetical protein AB7O57_00810 [Hyphomicrobiaceae bacterium]